MATYNLNVKVLNIEGLTRNDLNTFVRIHLHERNQFYKTETAQQDANPKFNENITIPVYDPQKDQLVVEVCHSALNDSEDICDPYLIPLNTMTIGNAIAPADLELKKDDQPVGTLHLELSLTQKDATEVATFKGPVLLRVNITDAHGVTEVNGDTSNDTYLLFNLQGHDESETIKSIVNNTSLDPAWNQSFSIVVNDPQNDVVKMKMISGETTIIEHEHIVIHELEPYTVASQTFDFSDSEHTGGHLTIEYETVDLETFSKKPVNIHLKVLNGRDLKKMDADKSDPYVIASVGDKEVQTEVQKNTLEPEWNQEFDFVSQDPLNDKLTLKLRDKDVAVDDKMADDIVFNVRDFKTPEDKTPVLYDVPLLYKGKPAGHLSFELLAEGECLIVKKASGESIVEFTVVKTDFPNAQNGVHIAYGILSNEEAPPIDVPFNEKVMFRCPDPQTDTLVVTFDDPEEGDDLCDPVVIPLNTIGLDGESEYDKDVTLDDEPCGHVHIIFFVREVGKEMKETTHPPESDTYSTEQVQERAAPIIEEYCDFQWGNYGSSYSTSFTGYSNCTPLSSTLDEAEIKFHKHAVLDDEPNAPAKPRRSETFSGQIKSIQLESAPEPLVVGEQYYATATLLGKSSRNSTKFPPIKSNPVEAKDANTLSFDDFKFDYAAKLKKGDFIDFILYHQSDNKQIAKSTIALEKVEQTDNEAPNTFDLLEYKFVKNPAKIGTLNADLKHTIQFQ